ncbi:MAG: 3'-5' exonuclease [Candidatus Aenigmatarchaeota archaeon]
MTNKAYVGGPGTGKTSRIVEEIYETIVTETETDVNYAYDIVIVTKTNSAKHVIKNRIFDYMTERGIAETDVRYILNNVRTIDSFSLDFFVDSTGLEREKIKKKIWEIIVADSLKKGKRSELIDLIKNVFGLEKINPDNLYYRSYYGSYFYEGEEVYLISTINFLDYILFKNGGLKYSYKDLEEFINRNINFFKAYKLIRPNTNLLEEKGKLVNVIDTFIYLIEKGKLYTFNYIVFSAIKEAKEKIKYIFVDEANELSPLYANFILNAGKNIVWGMDPMQTIYNFSGFSDLTYNSILDSKPQIIKLTTQYRIPANIYDRIIKFVVSEINLIGTEHLKRFFGNMYDIVLDYFNKTKSVVSGGNIYVFDKKFTKFDVINFMKNFGYDAIILTRRISFKNFLKKHINNLTEYSFIFDSSYYDKLLNILHDLFINNGKYSINEIKMYLKKSVYNELVKNKVEYIDSNYVKNIGLHKFVDNFLNVNERIKTKLIENLSKSETDSMANRIYVSTIHNTKGGEFDNVIVINDFSVKTLDKFRRKYIDVYLYEIFVIYVGMTRSKNMLYVIFLI